MAKGELKITLTPKQRKAFDILTDSHTRYLYYGGAGGGGKGWLGCTWIWVQMISYEDVRYFLARKELKRLRESTLNTFWKVVRYYGKQFGADFADDLRFNENKGVIQHVKTRSVIQLLELADKPSDPDFDDLGSLEFTGGFVDEAPEISAAAFDAVKTRIGRQHNDTYNLFPKLLLAGNPSKGWVYNEFYLPYRRNTLPKDHAFIQALPGDNIYLPKDYIELLKALPESSPRKQRILYGNWEYEDDPTVLMEHDKIMDIFTNDFVKKGRRYIVADIARKGRDKTVIGVWDGWRLIGLKTIARNDLSEARDAIEKLRMQYGIVRSNVLVDADGIGGGVVDFGGYKGFVAQARPVPIGGKRENYNHIKSQCYFYLADRVNQGELYVEPSAGTKDDRDRIILELEVVKRDDSDIDGKVKVISKDKMKEKLGGKSPDYADMFMMRCWFDLKPKMYLV